MTRGKLLKDLFNAYRLDDEDDFMSIADQIIQEEYKKNHHLLAEELEEIIMESRVNGTQRDNLNQHTLNDSLNLDEDLGDVIFCDYYMGDVVLDEQSTNKLERVLEEYEKRDLLTSHNLRPKNKILFYGPPGCGKSLTAKVVAGELGLPLMYVDFSTLISSFLGKTGSNISKLFKLASEEKLVLFFDEFDALGRSRLDEQEHGELKRVVSSFLQLLDNFYSESLIISATNLDQVLDGALWRRFDVAIEFDEFDSSRARELIITKFESVKLELDINLDKWSKKLSGRSGAMIERVCFDAAKTALLSSRELVGEDDFNLAFDNVTDNLRD